MNMRYKYCPFYNNMVLRAHGFDKLKTLKSISRLQNTFKKLFISLFLALQGLRCCMWAFFSCGHQELLSSWGVWASRCGDFSCSGAQALDTRASVVVEYGLSCSLACGIFPDQGWNPCPLPWQADSQRLDHRRSP